MTQANGVRIFLLGPLRIERDGAILHFPRRKVEALLAYLLLNPQPQTRDALAALFWGESADDKARHSLRTALATLRNQLGDSLLLADRNHVRIDPDFPLWVDLRALLAFGQEFDGAAPPEAAHLRSALALWQGHLLEGFYDDWVFAARQHHHTRLLGVLLNVTATLRAASHYPLAIEVAHKVLSMDAANEHAHQHLMFCYMATGDRAAALRQYELCEAALEAELDASPAAETTALYLWIKQRGGDEGSPAARITNLPIPLTSFVGRARQTSEVKRLLDPDGGATRLLTLTGVGGSGKTRLAIQAATDLIDSFLHGIWWVELGTLSDDDLLVHAVANTLGVREESDRRCVESIGEHLAQKQLLLVLDNCEHLIEPAAHLAAELLARCPQMQILATSREPLNIAGEVRWPLAGLPLPTGQGTGSPQEWMELECVRLFAERAAAIQQSFRLTPQNIEAVAAICTSVDGLPLAIELAAARVTLLPVAEIAERLATALGARFALLNQGSRTALPRHQTLRAAIDWSYDLLTLTERRLFRRLSVFRGGFTLAAVEQVVAAGDGAGGSAYDPASAQSSADASLLDLLARLVDRSLVVVDPHGTQHRYRLLETLREYALEQLAAAGEAEQLQRRHAAYYLTLAEQAVPELIGSRQMHWLDRLESEHPNLRAALDSLLDAAESERALRLAAALMRFWDYRGYAGEGREWLRKALALRTPPTGALAAKAMIAAGWLAYRQSAHDQARQLLQEAVTLCEREEEEPALVDAVQIMAMIEADQGDYETAKAHLESSLQLAHTLGYAYGIARGQKFAGALAWDEDRIEDAAGHYGAALEIFIRLDDRVSIANLHLNVGDTERMLDHDDSAESHYAECLALARGLGYKGLTGAVLKSMGMLAFKRQEYELARTHGEASLAILRELGDKAHIAFALSNLGDVANRMGDRSLALSYYTQNLHIMVEIGYKWPIFYALEDLAGLLAAAEQDLEIAVRFLGAAAGLRQETGIPVSPLQAAAYESLVAGLRWSLGEQDFAIAWQAGESAPLDQIVATAAGLTLD